jgi:FlaA1/EpsC-like NDP-sugar epimerase
MIRIRGVHRAIVLVVLDVCAVLAAAVGAYFIYFDFDFFPQVYSTLGILLPVALLIRLVLFSLGGLYAGVWRYASVSNLIDVFLVTTASSLVYLAAARAIDRLLIVLPVEPAAPIFVIDWLLLFLMVSGIRFGVRVVRELIPARESGTSRVVVVGAGDAGDMILRELSKNPSLGYRPVAVLDDDRAKRGMRMHGLRVVGTVEDIPAVVARKQVDEVVAAMPSASTATMRRVFELCSAAGVRATTVPSVSELVCDSVTASQIREIIIDDLLGREQVTVDDEEVSGVVAGKTVCITGAAGSIGSELARKALRFSPARLLLIDQAETPLFDLAYELDANHADPHLRTVVGDVGYRHMLSRLFADERPDVVFHAAAYKHVPLMESHPGEAIRNNLLATRTAARAAVESGVSRFVYISTDKAVNPSSVMGATKRAGELLVAALGTQDDTVFSVVRFGNVLGLQGSVVPLFQTQIASGGPVTVTHPDVERYFMAISEAVLLILQAATMSAGGDVFVLDMGDPVRIVDLARDMIRLVGRVPDVDIPIEIVGMRPGEKLYEELWHEDENPHPTAHPKILLARTSKIYDLQEVESRIDAVADALFGDRSPVEMLRELVPTFRPAADRKTN